MATRLVSIFGRRKHSRQVSGAWVFKVTRMPVAAIFVNIEAGANTDNIMEWFDRLERGQVKAVIEFAARSVDKTPEHVVASLS